MFIRKKKYPSGNIGVIVVEIVKGRMRELYTVVIATDNADSKPLVAKGLEWTDKESARSQPRIIPIGPQSQKETHEQELKRIRKAIARLMSVNSKMKSIIFGSAF